MSRNIETLAYLGPEGSFTHETALWHQLNQPLYRQAKLVPAPRIADVCNWVVNRTVDRGVVPIENSTDGPVGDTLEALKYNRLYIASEYVLSPLTQSLYYQQGVNLADIKLVISKGSAIGQCPNHLSELVPNATTEKRPSTVAAILEVLGNPHMAAIGPKMAGQIQGLMDRLAQIDNIQDSPLNATRFFVVDSQAINNPVTGNDKTTLITQMPDQPGSLYTTLSCFAEQNINLTKIKSFGKDGNDIAFLMILQGHQQELPLAAALKKLSQYSIRVKMLGSYPESDYQPPEVQWDLDMEYIQNRFRNEVANGANYDHKTVVVFTLKDRAGALRNTLGPFQKRNINLLEIDSLPTGGKLGEYAFYLVFENGTYQSQQAIEELTEQCTRVALLAKSA